jgi:hypothetical protein
VGIDFGCCQGTMVPSLIKHQNGVNFTVLQHWHFLILDPALLLLVVLVVFVAKL